MTHPTPDCAADRVTQSYWDINARNWFVAVYWLLTSWPVLAVTPPDRVWANTTEAYWLRVWVKGRLVWTVKRKLARKEVTNG